MSFLKELLKVAKKVEKEHKKLVESGYYNCKYCGKETDIPAFYYGTVIINDQEVSTEGFCLDCLLKKKGIFIQQIDEDIEISIVN